MDSSVSPKDEIWFLRVCHHSSTGLYRVLFRIGSGLALAHHHPKLELRLSGTLLKLAQNERPCTDESWSSV